MSTSNSNIEQCILAVKEWMTSHLLKFNDSKTITMEIRSKLKRGSGEGGLQIGHEVLSFSPTAKNIGVVFDSSLSLECHVNSMVSSAWSSLWRIGRIRKYLSKESAEIFIHAFVTSKLDYCNSLLFGLPNTLINKIQLVQNAAARIVTLTRKYDHITPVMRDLHWLPIGYRIKFKTALLVYKAMCGDSPTYIVGLLQRKPQSRLRSSVNDPLQLQVPRSKLITYGDRAFSVAAPKVWNELPLSIRQAESVGIFKRRLKSYLFKKAYND
jgi:hypothetical protein